MSSDYTVPAESLEIEIEVKKSRFIARAMKVTTKSEAKAFIEQARRDYSDARHHCWAYLLGNPGIASSAAMNDDGEPSGTAGKPILNVIQHKKIGDVIVVVIRYFGGVKLGAGGLTRAYSGATEAVLSKIKLEQLKPQTKVDLVLDFSHEQAVRYWLQTHAGEVVYIEYGEQVKMRVAIASNAAEKLRIFCAAHSIQLLSE